MSYAVGLLFITPLLTDRSVGFNIIDKSALRSWLEFHAEWLRDEPIDATATETGSYIPLDRCQLSPGNGDHEIWDTRNWSHFPSLFSHLEKGFCRNWGIFTRLVPQSQIG